MKPAGSSPAATEGPARDRPETRDKLRADERSVIEEMRLRQLELEAQNRGLLQAQADLKQACGRYIELYDLTPMGHVMVRDQNIISEANLTMCQLLDVEKQVLIGTRLTGWLKRESRFRFYEHRKSVLKSGARQSCELVSGPAGWNGIYRHGGKRPGEGHAGSAQHGGDGHNTTEEDGGGVAPA